MLLGQMFLCDTLREADAFDVSGRSHTMEAAMRQVEAEQVATEIVTTSDWQVFLEPVPSSSVSDPPEYALRLVCGGVVVVLHHPADWDTLQQVSRPTAPPAPPPPLLSAG